MCLITDVKEPYVADEDIFCYKVLNKSPDVGVYSSPFFGSFVWGIPKRGDIYLSSFEFPLGNVVLRESVSAYHGCSSRFDEASNYYWILNDLLCEDSKPHIFMEFPYIVSYRMVWDMWAVNNGFHSYTSFDGAELIWVYGKPLDIYRIARFIIPKGTRYYVSYDVQEYCSEKLVFDGFITKD